MQGDGDNRGNARLDNSRCNDYIPRMVGQLKKELAKRNKFDCLEQEAHLNLIRTADMLHREVEERVLVPAGLSNTQYNVLRILRGVGPSGLKCGEIADRLITRDPDITRLLDRLVRRGLVRRERAEDDRRVVRAMITEAGLKAIAPLDEPLIQAHRSTLSCFNRTELRTLVKMLERIRGALWANVERMSH